MKKLLSITLALIIATLAVVPAFAVQDCDCGKTPMILVSGMNTFPLVLDRGTENETQVFIPELDITSIALKTVGGLLAAAVFRDWNKFGDAFIPLANDLLEPVAFAPDGTSKYNVTTATFPESLASYPDLASGGNEFGLLHTACDKLGADHTYFFNYDWRADPVANAADLKLYIEHVKVETRHSKVDIAACSLGAAQILAYIEVYGTADLESCIFLSPMLSGAYIASESMTGKIEVGPSAAMRYLKQMLKTEDGSKNPITVLLDVLNYVGLFGKVLNLLNSGIDALGDRLADELIIDIFATMPGIWAAMRPDAYEVAKQNLLDPQIHALLIEKIDYFHYNVRLKTAEILQNAMDDGVKVAIVSHYNTPAIPLFESADETGDGVLDTYCTSGGATCAPIGETLPAGYVQKYFPGQNFISPDNIIDASTSILPDKVWFFKNLRHVGCPYNSEYNEFVFWLLEQEEQPTVFSNPLYPQFFATDDGGKTVYPLEAGAATLKETSSPTSIWVLGKLIANVFKGLKAVSDK